jgi:hypothetical protein
MESVHKVHFVRWAGRRTVPTKVAVVGGGPIVGTALESLLVAAGYHARFLPESMMDELDVLLAHSELLVVAPALSAERRQALLEVVLSPPGSAKIPVLELLPANGEERRFLGGMVLWPCSVEELKRAIDALLV